MKKLTCAALALVLLSGVPVAALAQDAQKPAQPPKPPKIGDKIVDFTLRDLKKRKINTAVVRKNRILVLKFGATWCPPCNKQIPELNKVVAAYGKQVLVLDVDVREKAADVRNHNRRMKVKYLTVLDSKGLVAERYGVTGIPVVIVAGKDATIAYRAHYTPFDRLKLVIDGLIEEEKKQAEKEKATDETKQPDIEEDF